MTLISIIIPTYNRANLIKETLDSVLVQTYSNWECIIIDDGSVDNTIEVIKKYIKKDSRFRFYKRPSTMPKGVSSARNFGIEKSTGKYVLFLDSDDLITNRCLENRISFVNENPNFDFWIFKTKTFKTHIEDNGKIFNREMEIYSDKNYLNMFFEGLNPFCITSPLWKKEILQAINGFDERLSMFEDPELHIRVFLNKFKSKTDLSLKHDSFYRLSDKEISLKSDSEKIKKINDSAFIFFKKYLKKNKKELELNCLNFYKNDILFQGTFYDSIRFYTLYVQYNVFKIKQIFLVPIIILYKLFGIENNKGFGIFKLRKYIFN